MQHPGSDRREFFRINDTVVIEYTVVRNHDIDQAADRINKSIGFDDSSEKIQLRSIQSNLNILIDNLNQSDREIARALRLLDEKINILALNVQRQAHPVNPDEMIEANLSGGGIAFMVETPIDVRETVEIYLQLLPSATQINALAKVVSCDKIKTDSPNRPYLLRMVFTEMDEQDRNLLVKHTLKRQAEALRANRKDSLMSLREI